MAIKLFRWIYTFIGIAVGYVVSQVIDGFVTIPQDGNAFGAAPALFIALFGALGFLLTPTFVRRGRTHMKELESALMKIPAERIAQYAAGLLIGAAVAFLISPIFSVIDNDFLRVGSTALNYLIAIYFGVILSRRIQMDRLNFSTAARDVGKEQPEAEPKRIPPKILDAGVILDGKIAEIIANGFLDGDIIIPEFVLVELRHTADSADSAERS
ncbi:MAG: hypothetical protein LBT52_03245, partial [Clostridiales Family XIII bacterium]|nr:hypothetical protein [Clostridiales Family XIII bacterium]